MRRFVAASQNPAPQKTKEGHSLQNEKKHPSCGQKIKPICGIHIVNLKNVKITLKFRHKSKEKTAIFERKQRNFWSE